MTVLRFVFVIFFYSLVFTESFKISRVYKSFFGGKSVTTSNDDFTLNSTGTDDESFSSDDDESPIENVDCSDLNSTLGRALKWVLVTTSNHERAPHVRFFLSSRKQPTRVEVHVGEQFRLDATDFKVERRTVFIVHGFKASGFKNWVKRMEEAFLLWGDVNVIVVDWSGGPKSFNYYDAAVNTKVVGNQIARFLQNVANVTIIEKSPSEPIWGTLHLVGHSLGAHICGVAARDFTEMQYNWRVNRITGLDPAQLCFRGVSSEFRLDRTDAPFVDIIHTSARAKSIVGFGNPDPIGHVDFYANGGKTQPGCSRRQGSVLSLLHVPKTPIETGKCSHQRSYLYFIESLIGAVTGNCTFWGRHWDPTDSEASRVSWEPCNANTCSQMGIRTENYPKRGTFFVATSTTPPFCISSPYE